MRTTVSPGPTEAASESAPGRAVGIERLRWTCAAERLPFGSTAEVEPVEGVIGQDAAVEALRFGLATDAPGQNIFVRGLVGTGRATLVGHLLEQMRAICGRRSDQCYVRNFSNPGRPCRISVPAGRGPVLRREADRLADFVRDDLQRALALEVAPWMQVPWGYAPGPFVVPSIPGDQALRRRFEARARELLEPFVRAIVRACPQPEVQAFLEEALEDIVEHCLAGADPAGRRADRYRVHVVLTRPAVGWTRPIVLETAPTLTNLLGAVDRDAGTEGPARASHLSIRTGSILRADGGTLILEARDLLAEPGAWKVLARTLKSGRLEITPPELTGPWSSHAIVPEALDVKVKVVLIGDPDTFAKLDGEDPDFQHLFKVLVDFESTIPRDDDGIRVYAGVLARISRDESLPPFDRGAVAALVEHGARVAARRGKLTAKFGRLADIAREAAHLASTSGRDRSSADDVQEAVRRSRRRADLPSRQFRELVREGTIRIETRERVVGQINGLAVLHAGPLTYGFPMRITSTLGPGTAGLIHIEREAALSGSAHTKGFYIVGGVLRSLLRTEHPLTFNASLAIEQSYGLVDGDSAAAAEVCCLLSSLTGVPLRQDMAVTGAVDQLGNVLAVGAVNEKIEGFYDICRDVDPNGRHAVLIPAANSGDLMLRTDVVEAAMEGRFEVRAVSTVLEALEALTGVACGTPAERAGDDSPRLLALAVARAEELWTRSASAR